MISVEPTDLTARTDYQHLLQLMKLLSFCAYVARWFDVKDLT